MTSDANATRAWIEYHRLLGAEHFYLVVNDCRDERLDCILSVWRAWVTAASSYFHSTFFVKTNSF